MARRIIQVTAVADYAHNAGFVGTDLVTIIAICGAESGYNANARALTSREDSRGLAQINVYAHPWGKSINLYDPATNLKAAWRVYREAGYRFTPWSTYNNGHYRNFWDLAVLAAKAVNPGAPPPPTVVWQRPPSTVPDDYSQNIRNIAGLFRRYAKNFGDWSVYIYRIYN